MSASRRPRHPVLLIVIDGWGLAPPSDHNAIATANLKVIPRLEQEYPATRLAASGAAVGLPDGQMGNSEVGHLTLGAGRILDQDFARITRAVRERRLAQNPVLRELFDHCRARGSALHLIGLLGPGGVHSHEEHLYGLLEASREGGVPRTWVHHALDGRDTPPRSAVEFVQRAEARMRALGHGAVATVQGRYWIMDRDKRWDRTERAYRCLTDLVGERAATAVAAVQAAYARGETDEFVAPTVVGAPDPVRAGDAVLIYNFRPDRVRQISRALGDPAFYDFPRRRIDARLASLTLLDKTFETFRMRICYPPVHPDDTLGHVYAQHGLRQLRMAETEKYAHVTYFFSGGRETPFAGEDRVLVPSPKVSTYDLQPEMSAREITTQAVQRIEGGGYDLALINFANPDMVGHTGKLEETRRACEVVDECVGRLADATLPRDWILAITADHGNAEQMQDPEGGPFTAHTTNPVPFILVHPSLRGHRLHQGEGLRSVAPTLLHLAGLPVPPSMDGPALLAPLAPRGSKGPT